MQVNKRKTKNDAYEALRIEAKKKGYFLHELWIEGVWLCYCMLKYTSDEDIAKERQREIEEREGHKIVYEGTLNNRANRNREPVMGKINLCRTQIGDYKHRAVEYWRRDYAENGLPDRSLKDVLQM